MPPTAGPSATPTPTYIIPETVFVKLFDWPFLAFVLLAVAIFLFREQLSGVFSRGDILLSWGENRSIRLRELSDSLDEELDPIRADIDALKNAVAALQSNVPVSDATVSNAPQVQLIREDSLPPEQKEQCKSRIKEALSSGEYQWRSIERLAILAGITESQVLEILRSDKDIILGMGKSGRQIARLASRTN